MDGHSYSRDERKALPHGEIIGVASGNWGRVDKVMQLLPEPENSETPGRQAFRDTLREYGFDWEHRRYLQADHIQDKEWGGSDSTDFANFWPMSGDANMSAGASTNGQKITFCPDKSAPAPITDNLRKLKKLLYGRFFRIRNVWIAPP